MIDLSSYHLRPLTARLRALRAARGFAERMAFLQAADAMALADEARATTRSPRPAATPVRATLAVSQSAAPFTGVTPAPTERRSLADEEWAMRKAGAAKGVYSPRSFAASSGAPLAASAPPSPAARSAIETKAALATGSQAAVVKLASYGSGSARAASLLGYQSDKGQLALEREDGTLIVGQESVAVFAAQWTEDGEREPSNDVFRVEIEFAGVLSHEEAQAGLAAALNGHHFAWRLDERDESAVIHLVAIAAGKERDERGKLDRIYANAKSVDRFHDRIEDAFGRDAELSAPAWAHGVEGATTQLAALTRAGALAVEIDGGARLKDAAIRNFVKQLGNANRPLPSDFNPSLQIAKTWQPSMRTNSPRDFAHVILSAKPGTDKEAFMDAARATLAREFKGHEYVFVMHTNREHIHVHAAVRLRSPTGEKLHPGIHDFRRWRETLAEEASKRHIPMEAVRRFDQAHAPAYKLKDIKMMERGIAPLSVRRRIERVKNREIHKPTREEGRRRAAEAAAQWKAVSIRRGVTLPALAPGAVRLYRAEAVNGADQRAPLYATERAVAESYASKIGAARIVYLDVPCERLSELRPSRENPRTIYVVPRALSGLSKPVNGIDKAAILAFEARAEAAMQNPQQRECQFISEEKSMRTAETMGTARSKMAESLSRIGEFIPDGDFKEEFLRRSKDLLDTADKATREQARLDRTPGEIAGERFVRPEPANVGALYTHEQKGEEIHYSRHDAHTGAFQTLAFVDTGKQLDVKDWNNPETVNAALKLGATKWETLTVNGSVEYKETVARLAAEHGYQITNPELQDRIRELRSEFEARRATVSEGRREEEAKAATAPEKPRADDAVRPTETNAQTLDGAALTSDRQFNAGPANTAAERAIHLAIIRERVDAEAQRETREAVRAEAAHETNTATGSAKMPYRSTAEAESAKAAERAVDDIAARPIPADPNQSEAIQSLRREQVRVLDDAEREQRKIDLENFQRLQEQERSPRREESEGESR